MFMQNSEIIILIGAYRRLTATLVLLYSIDNKAFMQSSGMYIFIGAYRQLLATLKFRINIFIGSYV